MIVKCGMRSATLGSEESTALSFPPPLRGRGRERGSHELRPLPGPPLSPTLPRKGGGDERPVPASHANFPPKFPNDSNPVLLCMGLFSTFLIGRPS
ncbi:hypothetical protein ABID62_004704 [Bradyrhizobium sp. S3.9.1]